jgi:predicted HD superfamily hydrolase involved in NAD metabolism
MGGSPVASLRAEVARRLSRKRLAHVEAVAETAREIAARGGWGQDLAEAALRAAWIHDACKEDGLAAWIEMIERAGMEPDPWALAHAPHLLHAQAAAAWASARGEVDRRVLEAAWYHPTAHAELGPAGRILFVADFCEPTRRFAEALDTAAIRERAGQGEEGLADAARSVLALRLRHLLEAGRPIHPDTFHAWNAWARGRAT